MELCSEVYNRLQKLGESPVVQIIDSLFSGIAIYTLNRYIYACGMQGMMQVRVPS